MSENSRNINRSISRNKSETTYLSCAVFISNALDVNISISTRKTNISLFLVLMLMLMSSASPMKTAQDK